jgi:hypothetical protein
MSAPPGRSPWRAPRWCRLYAIADALAQRWQVQFGRDWFHIYVWALFAFFCFVIFANVGAFSNVGLILYVLGFLGISVVVWRAHVGRHQGRFLDYRALLKHCAWRCIGISSASRARMAKQPIRLACTIPAPSRMPIRLSSRTSSPG